jgi:hypothetical protein
MFIDRGPLKDGKHPLRATPYMFFKKTHKILSMPPMPLGDILTQLAHPLTQYVNIPKQVVFGDLPLTADRIIFIGKRPLTVNRVCDINRICTSLEVSLQSCPGYTRHCEDNVQVEQITACRESTPIELQTTGVLKIHRNQKTFRAEVTMLDFLAKNLKQFVNRTIPLIQTFNNEERKIIYQPTSHESLSAFPWDMEPDHSAFNYLHSTLFILYAHTLRAIHKLGIVHGNINLKNLVQVARSISAPSDEIVMGMILNWELARWVDEATNEVEFDRSEFPPLTRKYCSERIGKQLDGNAQKVKYGRGDDLSALINCLFSSTNKVVMSSEQSEYLYNQMDDVDEEKLVDHSKFTFKHFRKAAIEEDYDQLIYMLQDYGGKVHEYPMVRGEKYLYFLTYSCGHTDT